MKKTVSFQIEEGKLAEFDMVVSQESNGNRSQVLRQLIEDFLTAQKSQATGTISANNPI